MPLFNVNREGFIPPTSTSAPTGPDPSDQAQGASMANTPVPGPTSTAGAPPSPARAEPTQTSQRSNVIPTPPGGHPTPSIPSGRVDRDQPMIPRQLPALRGSSTNKASSLSRINPPTFPGQTVRDASSLPNPTTRVQASESQDTTKRQSLSQLDRSPGSSHGNALTGSVSREGTVDNPIEVDEEGTPSRQYSGRVSPAVSIATWVPAPLDTDNDIRIDGIGNGREKRRKERGKAKEKENGEDKENGGEKRKEARDPANEVQPFSFQHNQSVGDEPFFGCMNFFAPSGPGSSSGSSSSSSLSKSKPPSTEKATPIDTWERAKKLFDIDYSDDQDDFEVLDPNSDLVKSIKWMSISKKPGDEDGSVDPKEEPEAEGQDDGSEVGPGDREQTNTSSASTVSLNSWLKRPPVDHETSSRKKPRSSPSDGSSSDGPRPEANESESDGEGEDGEDDAEGWDIQRLPEAGAGSQICVFVYRGWGVKFRRIPRDTKAKWYAAINHQRFLVMFFWDVINPIMRSPDRSGPPPQHVRAAMLKGLKYLRQPWLSLHTTFDDLAMELITRRRSWSPEMAAYVKSMPDLRTDHMALVERCDACELKWHRVKYLKVTLSGQQYGVQTLASYGDGIQKTMTLGSTCYETFTEAHAIFHTIHKVYGGFRSRMEEIIKDAEIDWEFFVDEEDGYFDIDVFAHYLDHGYPEMRETLMPQIEAYIKAIRRRRIDLNPKNVREALMDNYDFTNIESL